MTMQIRQPVSQPSPSTKTKKKLPWATVIPIGIAFCIVMFSSSWFQTGATRSNPASATSSAVMIRDVPPKPSVSSTSPLKNRHIDEKPEIFYTPVSTGKQNVLRYAAYVPTTNPDGTQQQQPLSVARWAASMAHEDEEYATKLAADLTKIIKDSGFSAVRFETKGASSCSSDQKHFEFVLVNDTFLSRFGATGDPSSFQEHFDKCQLSSSVAPPCCVFDNLSGSATLVAPMPGNDLTSYGHLAAFCRKAPTSQIYQTWRRVGQEFVEQLKSSSTVWFSTAGTGVAWLHFRFDDRPKYYHYSPFAEEQRDDNNDGCLAM